MKKLVSLLQKSSLDIASILDQVSDAIAFTDTNSVIQGWNKTAEKMYQWKKSEVVGKSTHEILPLAKNPKAHAKLVSILEKKGVWQGEAEQQCKDGSTITILSSISVVKNQLGVKVGYIMINRDITERKRAENVSLFKAEISRILASSLDYEKTLKNVVKIVVPDIADWCTVDIVTTKGLEPLAFLHKNKHKTAKAAQIRHRYPTPLTGSEGIARVMKTGKSVFYPHITDQLFQVLTVNSEHRVLLSELGFTSLIIVPITIRQTVIGGILLAKSSGRFNAEDFEMAQQLAFHASLAIENAQLYRMVEQEHARLERLVSDVPGVVWEAWGKPDDNLQQINFVSKYVETLLGYSVEDWLSFPNFWLSIVHPDDKKRAAAEARAKFDSKEPGISRFRWIRKDGKTVWVEAQSAPILNKRGHPVGMRGVTMDITERMNLENKKNEFISAASHELKTPLTTQKAFIQLLLKKAKEEKDSPYLSYLEKISKQTDRLANLISDLLDISKIEAGKLMFEKELLDLDECIKSTIEDFQQTLSAHKIKVSGSLKGKYLGDANRISQVIINLLSNAVKYSPQQTKVLVKLQETPDNFTISVVDYGIGISKTSVNKIFERFYRDEAMENGNFPGLGIGLYISQQIAKAHGGEITVKSSRNKGSQFTLILHKSVS